MAWFSINEAMPCVICEDPLEHWEIDICNSCALTMVFIEHDVLIPKNYDYYERAR